MEKSRINVYISKMDNDKLNELKKSTRVLGKYLSKGEFVDLSLYLMFRNLESDNLNLDMLMNDFNYDFINDGE